MAILAIFASLLGCGKNDPHILDGPGMVYVDSDYRTEYANCLPFENVQGSPYLAIAYLGKGEYGKANKESYINKIFANLDEEKIRNIPTYEYEGEDWFLVIPRYKSLTELKDGEEKVQLAAQAGEAFVVCCNQDVTVNLFEATKIEYKLSADANGQLQDTGEAVWDITNIEQILKS